MITFRYFAKQLVISWLALTLVLLLVIISGRFIKYLQQAAMGDLSPQLLFGLMGYRLPGFLETIIPLAFFMAILLSYGRMYADSEMIALEAGGFSQRRLLCYTFLIGLVISVITALFSFWITPWGMDNVDEIFRKQRQMTAFDAMTTGRFQSWNGQTSYVQRLKQDRQVMDKVFIAQHERGRSNVTLLLANSGRVQIDSKSKQRYLVLSDGYRYDITPGKMEGRAIQYATYGIKMQKKNEARVEKEGRLPFAALYRSKVPEYQAEWQWRLSLPIQVLISILIAVPMAKVNPRQGRYLKLLPGIIIFLTYFTGLISAKGAIKDGNLSAEWGMLMVHSVYVAIGIVLYFGRPLKDRVLRFYKK